MTPWAYEAADATCDVFMQTIQALPGLTKAASFKAGLFTIAHNVAVTRAERRDRPASLPSAVHEEAFGSFDVPDACRLDDPELAAGDHEAAALVWEAAAALNARDYALLDLHVRQGLGSADIATVMGVTKPNAATMVNRMKAAAGEVISSYIVARRGSKDCPGLQGVLAGVEFPPYTEPVRQAVDAHVKDCETCQASKRRLAAPMTILGAFAAVPAPLAMKGDIWGDLSGAWATSGAGAHGGGAAFGARDALPVNPYRGALGGAGGGGLGGGFTPMPAGGGDWDRNKLLLFGGAAIGLVAFAFGAGALLVAAFGGGGGGGGGGGDGGGGGGLPAATRTPVTARTSTPERTVGVSIQTPTPNLTPSKTPQPSETATELPPTETPTIEVTATRTPRATSTPRVSPTIEASATRTPRGSRTATPTP